MGILTHETQFEALNVDQNESYNIVKKKIEMQGANALRNLKKS